MNMIDNKHFYEEKTKFRSWKENEVAGFIVFSQQLFSYF